MAIPAIAYSPDYGLDLALKVVEWQFVADNLEKFYDGELNLLQLAAAYNLARYIAANVVLGLPFPEMTTPFGTHSRFGRLMYSFVTGEIVISKPPQARPTDYSNSALPPGMGFGGGGRGMGMSEGTMRYYAEERAHEAALQQQIDEITGAADYARKLAQDAAMTHTWLERAGYYARATGEAIANTWNDPKFQAALFVTSFLPVGAIVRGIGIAAKLSRFTKVLSGFKRGISFGMRLAKAARWGHKGKMFKIGYGIASRLGRGARFAAGRAPKIGMGVLYGFVRGTRAMGRIEPWVAHYGRLGRPIARTDYNAYHRGIAPWVHHHLFRLGNQLDKHFPGEWWPWWRV